MTLRILVLLVVVTAYAPSAGGINAWGDGQTTYYGLRPGPGIAACGWDLPAFSLVHVPGHGTVMCGDRGGELEPMQVDLWAPDEMSGKAWGRQMITVTVILWEER